MVPAALVMPETPSGSEGVEGGIQPDEARRRAERGRALIEREYSPARYREKVARAYAAIEEKTRRHP